MSGHKDPSKGRMLMLLLVVSLVGTGILYFDARGIELDLAGKEKEIDALNKKVTSLNQEIDQMKRDGVPSPSQNAILQKHANDAIQFKATITHLETRLAQCKANAATVTPPPIVQPSTGANRRSILDKLNQIGKD